MLAVILLMTFPVIKITRLWRARIFYFFSPFFPSRDYQTWSFLLILILPFSDLIRQESWRNLLQDKSFRTVEHVMTMWSYEYGSELRSINALSSLSILTSTVRNSLMTLLKFKCSKITVSSFMRSPDSCFLRYNLLERLFVIYVSNIDHNLGVVSHPSRYTSSRLQAITGSCLPPLNPSPLNPHLTYLQVLLIFPARSCENLVALATLSPSFVINKVFFVIEFLDFELAHRNLYLWHIAFLWQPLGSATNCYTRCSFIPTVVRSEKTCGNITLHAKEKLICKAN